MSELPLPSRRSGRATPALRGTTGAARRVYQPADGPPNGTETL